jgi:hypothetical protein
MRCSEWRMLVEHGDEEGGPAWKELVDAGEGDGLGRHGGIRGGDGRGSSEIIRARGDLTRNRDAKYDAEI